MSADAALKLAWVTQIVQLELAKRDSKLSDNERNKIQFNINRFDSLIKELENGN